MSGSTMLKHGFRPIHNLPPCTYPPYSPFLNPIEELFSIWRWKACEQATFLQAIDDACNDITADQCQAWIHRARIFIPRCLANENIHCDVDENLWPNPQDRVEGNIEVQ